MNQEHWLQMIEKPTMCDQPFESIVSDREAPNNSSWRQAQAQKLFELRQDSFLNTKNLTNKKILTILLTAKKLRNRRETVSSQKKN